MLAAKQKSKRKFPWTDRIGGHDITVNLMQPEDQERLLAFTQDLTKDDMMFLRLDISKPEVIADWVDKVRTGQTTTVLATNEAGEVVAYCSLHYSTQLWTSHIGEMRIFVSPDYRGIGLSKRLVTDIFQMAGEQKLERVQMNVAREQHHFQRMLESLGFRVEALLTDWLKDKAGRTHDLIVMSHWLGEY